MSGETRTCNGCGREFPVALWRQRRWGTVCNQCCKREWRRRNGAAVEREREASRRWKRKNLGQPGQPRVLSDPPAKISLENQSDPATAGTVRGHGNQEGPPELQYARYTPPGGRSTHTKVESHQAHAETLTHGTRPREDV